ncbi:YkgJ family cysteine cluster protein [Bradyrhizobium genosp. P]|uniref:YkgJ family cysteine cluster protein n=1 Tax=Bradyrhizobium genosp. P TaxID=83641 RepID=UPI003CF8D5F7
MNLHFACNSCGKCCHGHHISLTLHEALRWVDDGGLLVILIEAFLENGDGVPPVQRDHAQRRSLKVRCGGANAYVTITFAAYNIGTCRFLTKDKRCGIYEHRPLVCQIYPVEINPHIQLRPEHKDCAPETWDETGPMVYSDGRVVDGALAQLIEQSRQADRDDIGYKADICQELGMDVTALKGDGFAVYLPDTGILRATIEAVMKSRSASAPREQEWSFYSSRTEVISQLGAMNASIMKDMPRNATFVPI